LQSTTAATITATTLSQQPTATQTSTKPFDYKDKHDCLNQEIETKWMQKVEALLAQNKVDSKA